MNVDYTGTAKAAGSAIHVKDPRLDHIQDLVPHLFTAKNCLDIGCNAGGVSCQLGKRENQPCIVVASDYNFTLYTNHSTAFDYHAASVTGVDIDPKLVGQANSLLALRASRVRPPTKQSERSVDWFPMSAVLKHGYVEPVSHSSHGSMAPTASLQWPRVSFYAADWATDPDSTRSYDVILALSVSIKQSSHWLGLSIFQVIKWIHLEHLDQGLKSFFAKCATSLASGGNLVIELQTWESYEKAVRPSKAPHFLPNFKQLQYRPETSFDQLLADQGLTLCASSDAFRRPIRIYRKNAAEHGV